MNAYIDTFKVTDENGEKSIFYPLTKQEAVEGLEERLANLEVVDITETEDTTLENSNAGRLLFTEIDGAMEQGANPSPTNPQEIRNVAISGIRTHGKNLFDCGALTVQTINGITFTPIYENGLLQYVNVNGTATAFAFIDFPLNSFEIGAYIMNGYCSTSGIVGVSLQCFKNNTSNQIGNDRGSGAEFTLEESANIFIRIAVTSGTVCNNLKFYPMIRYLDVEDATYEPYTESVITFSQPIELSDSDKVINTESGFVLIIGETEEALPIADQIALNSLQTFDGITYVEFVSEIKPTFSAKYGTTEMGGMTLESLLTARSNDLRLSAVESAVINNI